MSRHSLFLWSCLTLLASLAFIARGGVAAEDVSPRNPDATTDRVGADSGNLPTMAPIDTVYIRVGDTWEFHARGRTPSGEPPTLIGVVLPAGAVMTDVGDGWFLINWLPHSDDVGRHVLRLRAMNEPDPNRQFDQDIVVEVQPINGDRENEAMVPAAAYPGGSVVPSIAVTTTAGTTTGIAGAATSLNTASLKSTKDTLEVARQIRSRSSYIGVSESTAKKPGKTTVVPTTNVARQAPLIAPIATPIISAGRALTIRVTPEHDSDNELPPIIHIDRLPPNASFDANEDGSRTFYWPTSDSDQGQHRFRFTVIHSNDASLKSTQDMTVIVGDPTKQFTTPADR